MTRTDVPPGPNISASQRRRCIDRNSAIGLLFAAFDLSFILSPFWRVSPVYGRQIGALILICAAGLFWAFLAGGTIECKIRLRWSWLLAATLLLLGVLCARPLTQGVAFRGDEDWHFERLIRLLNLVKSKQPGIALAWLASFAAFGVVILRPGRKGWQIAAACVGLAAVQAALIFWKFKNPATLIPPTRLMRFPMSEPWLGLLPLYLVSFGMKLGIPWHNPCCEVMYRIVPFLSAVLLAWYAARQIPSNRPLVRLLMALAVGSQPLVYYYSSILYLEMPAVLMMTVVCFQAARLLTAPAAQLRSEPAWYALLAIGFFKETAVAFLAAFVVCRAGIWIGHITRQDRKWRGALGELAVATAVLLPLGLFLVISRLSGPTQRTLSPEWRQLLEGENYRILGQAYFQQFGPILLLALAGAGVMLARRRYAVLAFFVVAFVADAVMHLIDLDVYIGYSRFNLFLLPMLIASAWHAVDALAGRWRPAAWLALALTVAANLYPGFPFCPFHLQDGSRIARWGDDYRADGERGFDTTDHTYPYRQVIWWLNHEHLHDRILFTGKWYNYHVEFYAAKGLQYKNSAQSNWLNHDDVRAIAQKLSEAKDQGFNVVVYHLYGLSPPHIPLKKMSGYVQIKLVSNAAHALVVYELQDQSALPETRPIPAPVEGEENPLPVD